MTCTEIYLIPLKGQMYEIGEAQNSHRGAYLLWLYLWGKYMFPIDEQDINNTSKDPLEYCVHLSFVRYDFGLGNIKPGIMKKFTDLVKEDRLEDWEKWLFSSTFDHAILLYENIPQFIRSIEQWLTLSIDTGNWDQQLEIIKKAYKSNKEFLGIAWNITSVSCDTWQVEDMSSSYRLKQIKSYVKSGEIDHYRMFDWKKDRNRKDVSFFFIGTNFKRKEENERKTNLR